MKKYRLLVETNDEKGLVYKISKVLYSHDLNIDKNSEFVDKNENKFFMRTVISGDFDTNKLLDDIKNVLPENSSIQLKEATVKDIVILATKEMHCLGDLLIKYQGNKLNANIKAVVSNHDSLRELVEKFNIPFEFISHENISREKHEHLIAKAIKKYNYDAIVLAKYMRILSADFVSWFEGKLLNIHHSFLPAFIGANPYKQAFERGVKIIGATSHFVTTDLDDGPIIAQGVTYVDHNYTWQAMRDSGQDIEKNVLSNALQLVLRDKVFVYKNKTIIL